MILVLAGRADSPARRLVERWRAHAARLLTPSDLSHTGWCQRIGDAGDESAVVSRARIDASAIRGVITRIAGVGAADLPHVAETDREYVACEMNAFLLGWLARLPCPVFNRPVANGLMGAPHAVEGWVALAARAGLALPWTRRAYPRPPESAWPADAVTVSVLGARSFGDVEPALARQACRLAEVAQVELLAVGFAHAGADATFLGAHAWPDVSHPALADALLERILEPSRARRALAEACA
jgi:hypothetical protein